MTDWRAELLTAFLVTTDMVEDPDERRRNLDALSLPPIFETFNALQDDFHLELGEGRIHTGRLNVGLPKGATTALYNCGVTHFFTRGESEEVMGIPNIPSFNEVGRYFDWAKAAVTEGPYLNSNQSWSHNAMRTIFHEAGHALSFCIQPKKNLEGHLEALLTGLSNLPNDDAKKEVEALLPASLRGITAMTE